MSDNTELARRVRDEVHQVLDRFNVGGDASIRVEKKNTQRENSYFVQVETNGNYTATALRVLMDKDMVFGTYVWDNKLIIECEISTARYV